MTSFPAVAALAPLLLAAGLSACAASPSAASGHASPPAQGALAWARLTQTLPGTWGMPGKERPFLVSYKLISGGSALMEAWGAGTPHETATVFHLAGDDLMLTHYCAQGNQPRLRLTGVTGDAMLFHFADVTNRAPGQAMLVARTLRFIGGAYEDTETYVGPDGRDETTSYRFTRVALPAGEEGRASH